jgi:hypothetical protein
VKGSEAEIDREFEVAFGLLERKIEAFVALPFEALNDAALKRELDRIGQQ